MDANNINLKTYTAQLVGYLDTSIADEMILNSYIRDLEVKEVTKKDLTVSFSSAMAIKLIEGEFAGVFAQGVKEIFGFELTVRPVLSGAFVGAVKETKEVKLSEKISPKYTFKNYVGGTFNSEVLSVALRVVETPGKFSPYYISSNSGLGKSHLLHAIGNGFIEKNQSVIYIEPNAFTRSVIETAKKGGEAVQQFIDHVNSFDVLLFDDIQNLGDRQATLKVLFNILNDAFEKEKQVVISSDKVAQELSGFESRFITRFSSGLSSVIQPPSIDDLIKVLEFKLGEEGMKASSWEDDALRFVARNNTSSIRSLEGAIKRVVFFTESETNLKYTYVVVSNIFKELSVDPSELTPSRVILVVSNYYKINKKEIIGKSRKQNVVLARHIAMWLIREINKLSYAQIGKVVGGRDHSTVLSAINKVELSMKMDKSVRVAVDKIEHKIKSIT
ncbi:MAG: chromosomal replication initiator protein DnaA [Mycoplasmataceae bacterium]|nr:chromosomal replication initiator protein DnaA [Mycoplasmataceae bacterium]